MKTKMPINALCAERLKYMLHEEKISQAKLAKCIPFSQQSLSRIMQLKQPLTLLTATNIIHAVNKVSAKRYRIEWLLGMDEFMLENERNMISPVFWTYDLRFAFQYVDGYWRVYDEAGDFVIEFRTHEETFEYIAKVDKQLQEEKRKNL